MTPARVRALSIEASVPVVVDARPSKASTRFIVSADSPAALASAPCDHRTRPRAARTCAPVRAMHCTFLAIRAPNRSALHRNSLPIKCNLIPYWEQLQIPTTAKTASAMWSRNSCAVTMCTPWPSARTRRTSAYRLASIRGRAGW
jgi:hypothetical protein